MAEYSAKQQVRVILYPHSLCYLATAEVAYPYVKNIDNPNLKLAINLCHEVRAGNANRISQVFENVRSAIGAVIVSGSDSVADFTKPMNMDRSTIKPIGLGNYDLRKFISALNQSDYRGKIGFINFKIEEEPTMYLQESIQNWKNITKEITKK